MWLYQFLWAMCIVLLCFDGFATENNQEVKSVFSIFEQEVVGGISENKSIWINPDEEDKQGNTLIPKKLVDNRDCDIAELKIIDVSFGKSVNLKNLVREKLDFSNLQIETKRCIEEVAVSLSPQYKAFIEITNKETSTIVFSGWIFSSYRSFSQPAYGNYFFTLNRCLSKE